MAPLRNFFRRLFRFKNAVRPGGKAAGKKPNVPPAITGIGRRSPVRARATMRGARAGSASPSGADAGTIAALEALAKGGAARVQRPAASVPGSQGHKPAGTPELVKVLRRISVRGGNVAAALAKPAFREKLVGALEKAGFEGNAGQIADSLQRALAAKPLPEIIGELEKK